MWAKAVAIALVVVSFSRSTGAQSWGTIYFANRNIPTASGTGGGNGNGTYNVPIWEFGNGSNGAGDLPGGVTVGLFFPGDPLDATPIASSPLRTDANSQFFAIGRQIVQVPGVPPGGTTDLVVRAWQGKSLIDAIWSERSQYESSWLFSTRPLGGISAEGSLEIPTPSMTGWGPESGAGLQLFSIGGSFIAVVSPARGSVFQAPATVPVTAWVYSSGGLYPGYTNAAIYLNSSLVWTQQSFPTQQKWTGELSIGPLGAGSYTLTAKIDYKNSSGGYTYSAAPVNFVVIDPIQIPSTQLNLTASQFSFTYAAKTGFKYVVEASGDLANWQPVSTNTAAADAVVYAATLGGPTAFYRVRVAASP